MPSAPIRRVGLIVNPYAGRGGPLALRGSDGLPASGPPSSAVRTRTRRTLRRLATGAERLPGSLQVLAAPGMMGEALIADVELTVAATLGPDGPSSAEATRRAACAAVAAGVDLLLFAGGDGTARDVTGVTGTTIPVLGIPAGVKMQSGVFGATPEAAADAALEFLADPNPDRCGYAEVLDTDEAARRAGVLAPQLYGEALVPRSPTRVLSAKSGPLIVEDRRLAAACEAIATELSDDALTLIGPGSTTERVTAARGLKGTLLGVDAIAGGELVGRDLDETGVLALLDTHTERPPRLLLGVVGGQGMLLGRGNQQLSAAVLRRVNRDAITVLAARDKLLALAPARLRVDTGDPAVDEHLGGHLPVRVAPHERLMMEVGP